MLEDGSRVACPLYGRTELHVTDRNITSRTPPRRSAFDSYGHKYCESADMIQCRKTLDACSLSDILIDTYGAITEQLATAFWTDSTKSSG
jgi:hypothetical protein